jgi:hypothetical protein
MAHDVFISYSNKDKKVADGICHGLETRGLRCWIAPRDVMPGQNWGSALVDAIENTKVVVLVFSSNANSSAQVYREMERAVSDGKPIIPVRIEDIAPSRDLEFYISAAHWMDVWDTPQEQYTDRLAQNIGMLAGAQVSVPEKSAPSAGLKRVAGPARGGARTFVWIGGAAVALLIVAIVAWTFIGPEFRKDSGPFIPSKGGMDIPNKGSFPHQPSEDSGLNVAQMPAEFMGGPPRLIQTNRKLDERTWEWEIHLRGSERALDQVRSVTYTLHPTFDPRVVTVTDRSTGFRITKTGWGTFSIPVKIEYHDGRAREEKVQLEFRERDPFAKE